MTFEGLKSRWTMPSACTSASASAIRVAMRDRLRHRQRPAARARRSSVSPSTRCMTRYGWSSAHADLVHGDHRRMIDARGRARLAQQPFDRLAGRRARCGRQQLDRHLARELGVLGEPHLAHRAVTERLDQAVVGNGLARRGEWIHAAKNRRCVVIRPRGRRACPRALRARPQAPRRPARCARAARRWRARWRLRCARAGGRAGTA